MKIELHAHTAECDTYAALKGFELVRHYHSAGYGGIVITDHYFSMFFDWFKDEIEKSNKRKTIERYLRGYYSARNEGEKLGFAVLCGAEVRLADTVNDYLVYGLDEEDFYILPFLNEFNNVRELVSALPDYAVVVQAHPFRDNMTVCNPNLLFGIEVYNGGTEMFRNEMAQVYAEHYGKRMTSGSDVHKLKHVALGGIETNRDIRTSRELVDVLKSGEYSLIKTQK